ncbi:MAG TPA: hypothetical protein VGL21_12350 [Jatrophihabitantaceae bacterium]|jgi:hypothetical protein
MSDEGDESRHVWQTLGYRRLDWSPGRTTVAWTAGRSWPPGHDGAPPDDARG